jgi:2-iminobutanoate/2-iminopropanoate deaminase
MKLIHAESTPPPKGHYSQAVLANGMLFLSGILPDLAPEGQDNTFARQTRSVFEKALPILQAGGSSLAQVVQCTAYISDIEDWPEFNQIFAEIFGEHRPARTVVPVKPLHYGFKVEIQLIAQTHTS